MITPPPKKKQTPKCNILDIAIEKPGKFTELRVLLKAPKPYPIPIVKV